MSRVLVSAALVTVMLLAGCSGTRTADEPLILDCSECGTDGYIECLFCRGEGLDICDQCSGEGYYDASAYPGYGQPDYTDCYKCDGEGVLGECTFCDGTGGKQCTVCEGTGFIEL